MYQLHKSGSTNSSGTSSMTNSFNNGSDTPKSNGANNFIFPPPTGSLEKMDKGTLLLDTLNILFAVQTLEIEKERKEKGKGKNVTNKKDGKNEAPTKTYEFKKDMFHFSNMEAFLHVTHFLFDVYDPTETEQRFRNVWPIYDKKMEALYRRVVLEWLKEIVEKYPHFFRGLKVEAIGGLIVNPGGERFLKLIHSFSTFILHSVCVRKQQQGYVKRPVLDYVENSHGTPSQIKNKQMYTLQNLSNQLMHETLAAEKKLVQGTLQHRKLMEDLQNRKLANQSQFDDSKFELLKKIQKHPDLFPENAFALLEKRKDYISKISSFDQLIFGNVAPDPLCRVLLETIKEKSDETMEKLNDIATFFDRHDRLWLFLRMDRTNSAVLDGSKLFKPRGREDGYPSLNNFIASATSAIDAFCKEENIWDPVDPSVTAKYASLRQSHHFLGLRANDLRKTDGDLELYRKNLDFEIKVLSMKLNEIDWRYLSNSDNIQSMTNMLTLTPAKMFDVNRTTGYTPALDMFLSQRSKDVSGTPSRFQVDLRSSAPPNGDTKLKSSFREYAMTQAATKQSNGISKLSFLSSSIDVVYNENNTVVDAHSSRYTVSNEGNLNGSLLSSVPPKFRNGLPAQEIAMDIFPLDKSKDNNEKQIGPAGDCPSDVANSSQYKTAMPVELNADVRISRLLESLRNSPIGDVKISNTNDSLDSKFDNNSLVDDWESEKGLMDMSISNISFINDDND